MRHKHQVHLLPIPTTIDTYYFRCNGTFVDRFKGSKEGYHLFVNYLLLWGS